MKKNKKNVKIISKKVKRGFLSLIFALLAFCSFHLFEQATPILELPQSDHAPLLYSNHTRQDLQHTFVSAIQQAKKSVLLVVYTLKDPKIIEALNQKSQEGISIKLIYDGRASPFVDRELSETIDITRRFGEGLMHLKILAIDDSLVFIGSANMTTASLLMHGNLVAAFNHPALHQWITSKTDSLKEEERSERVLNKEFLVGTQKAEFWFLPDNREAASKIKTLIESAKKTLKVAMFMWTRRDFAEAVVAAAKRGVNVEVFLDSTSVKGAGKKTAKFLQQNKIQVKVNTGKDLLHHKFMYIDEHTLVNGSANWTKAAFTQNDDCFIVLHDLSEEHRNQMNELCDVLKKETVVPKIR
jgi:cardiolipin synthase A/B